MGADAVVVEIRFMAHFRHSDGPFSRAAHHTHCPSHQPKKKEEPTTDALFPLPRTELAINHTRFAFHTALAK